MVTVPVKPFTGVKVTNPVTGFTVNMPSVAGLGSVPGINVIEVGSSAASPTISFAISVMSTAVFIGVVVLSSTAVGGFMPPQLRTLRNSASVNAAI